MQEGRDERRVQQMYLVHGQVHGQFHVFDEHAQRVQHHGLERFQLGPRPIAPRLDLAARPGPRPSVARPPRRHVRRPSVRRGHRRRAASARLAPAAGRGRIRRRVAGGHGGRGHGGTGPVVGRPTTCRTTINRARRSTNGTTGPRGSLTIVAAPGFSTRNVRDLEGGADHLKFGSAKKKHTVSRGTTPPPSLRTRLVNNILSLS